MDVDWKWATNHSLEKTVWEKKKDENVGKSYNITGPDLSFVILS